MNWLDVSIEGFAEQNAARPKTHLVKELVQNALDALPETGGRVALTFESRPGGFLVRCDDHGCGIDDLSTIRTVFWTSKNDSHIRRGRMGRGFKEMLCLAEHAEVHSKGRCIRFSKEQGEPVIAITSSDQLSEEAPGTSVLMLMPWDPAECRNELTEYFASFILPADIEFIVNGTRITPRAVEFEMDAILTTEAFVEGRWKKPQRRTHLRLVATRGREEPLIHEMGIPVCPVEWDQPYHIDVAQRVPMNPNRDAVMSGYPAALHRACLPILIERMTSEEARAGWVGDAGAKLPPAIQDKVLATAFGENLVRSVPAFGAYSPDDDAREQGFTVLDVRQLQGGYRDMAKERLETTKILVRKLREEQQNEADQAAIDINNPTQDPATERALQAAGGIKRVRATLAFAEWFCGEILLRLGEKCGCRARVGWLKNAHATWSHPTGILTLSIEDSQTLRNPGAPDFLALLIHEVAHQRAAHHGLEFIRSTEECAGHACRLIFEHHQTMHRLFFA